MKAIQYKKTLLLSLATTLLMVFSVSVPASGEAYTDDWYVYNGSSILHSFSVRFPTNWQAQTLGNTLQGFAPNSTENALYFSIREFEGQTYEQVINYYIGSNTQLVEVEDTVRTTQREDLLSKKVILKNIDLGNQYALTLIKRGSSIFVLTNANLPGEENFPVPNELSSTVQSIHDSFVFTDQWRQYIDYKDNYSFIFPATLNLVNLSNGVEISNPSYLGGTLFQILKFPNLKVKEAAAAAEGYGESIKTTEQINFHGMKNSLAATYKDSAAGKELGRIIVARGENSFSLSNINLEDNFPHLNYYDQYVVEMLESFEFFEQGGRYSPYEYFPDVRDNHPNAYSINALKTRKILDGYPNGTFLPDDEINRAELTKIIVSIITRPSAKKYNNCFPDVNDEWYAPYVCFAHSKGWISGYEDGFFKPANPVNRAEALKIIFEILLSKDIDENETLKNTTVTDVNPEDWYLKYFIFADNRDLLDKQHSLIDETGYQYRPFETISRKEVAETIYRTGRHL